jgi:hypothetical protein
LKLWTGGTNSTKESHKIIPAVGGVDVHAFNVKMGFLDLKIFPYDEVFRTITNPDSP